MTTSIAAQPPLRIAHVVLQLDVGGMEKLLVEFARHGNRERFDHHFISLGGSGRLTPEFAALGVKVVAMNEPPGLRPGIVLRLARRLRELNINIVHTHNTKPLLYGGLAAKMARADAMVHTRHGQRYRASRRDTALFALACRLADRIVGVSKDNSRLCVQDGIPERKVYTVWNGIDLSRFEYRGPQESGPAVLVARLSPEKDVATLLRATALVVERRPNFRLEIAGEGECASALKQLARELKIDQHVNFLGEVQDVPNLLGRASLFVLPSLTEGISLTLLEAMARGLPVVATRVGGNPEVVMDGQTGLLVAAGNPQELADAMVRLLDDPELGRRMGSAARQRVERHFDVRRTVADYEAIYEQLCPRRSEQLAGDSVLV